MANKMPGDENNHPNTVALIVLLLLTGLFVTCMICWITSSETTPHEFDLSVRHANLIDQLDLSENTPASIKILSQDALARENLARMEYRTFREHHKKNVFVSQLRATAAITRVSILTTVIGIALVLFQFIIAIMTQKTLEDAALEIGPQGLKLKTSFIGFLMIAFGLFFWLAFLEKAYEIKELGSPPSTIAAQ